MPKKYNLALTPISKSDEAVNCANGFSKLADKYLLGDGSLPHVTLYQFNAEEKEIDGIWNRVSAAWEEGPIELEFKKFSCITFDNSIFWVSLLPDNCDKLHEMHALIAHVINLPIIKSFDPHMTLISTKDKDYEKEVDKQLSSYRPISDKFVLTLGESDDVGQVTKMIYCCEVKSRAVCRM